MNFNKALVDRYEISIKEHRKNRGKIIMTPKVPVRDSKDLSIWYTPGVAGPSMRIKDDPDEAYELTRKRNSLAVVSDGSRVLGLGDIGPLAALPVMEGKALLFKYFGGVDAVPIVIDEHDVEGIVRTVKAIAPSFGGINLEDIKTPTCFYVLERLQKELEIPVRHDDQQGTAVVVLAALKAALEIVNKSLNEVEIILFGLGASNYFLYKLLKHAGADPRRIVAIDSKGVVSPKRELPDYKRRIAEETDPRAESVEEAFEGADVVIAASRPGPGVIKRERIERMNEDPIVFALANPVPEIMPDEAKRAGARIVATGRSDLPNQVNNSLAFPAVFRGTFDARAKKITMRMILAASEGLYEYAKRRGISEDYIIPRMTDPGVYEYVAAKVATAAVEDGVARRRMGFEEFYEEASRIISKSRAVLESVVRILRDRSEFFHMPVEKHVEEDKTIVLTKPGTPIREKEFSLKDLKNRGLSLYYGTEVGGEEGYFLATENLEVGDIVESGSVSYTIKRVIEKLPKKSKVYATVSDDGLIRIYLKLYNIETGEYEEHEIFEEYAEDIINRMIEKLKLGEIRESLKAADVITHLEKGDCVGIGIDIKESIPKYKRILRAARKLLKRLSYGEFRMKLCDINSYRVSLRIPTLELLEASTAKEVESLLGMFARPEV